jgi:hypothetical protein
MLFHIGTLLSLSLTPLLTAATPLSLSRPLSPSSHSFLNTTLFNQAIATRNCGTTPSLEKILQAEAHFAQNRIFTSKAKILGVAASSDETDGLKMKTAEPVNVYFHVLSDNATTGGYVNDSQIIEQIEVMNRDYNATGISFKLVNVTRTVNETWFEKAGPGATKVYQTAMKNHLRIGGVKDLNIYTVGFKGDDTVGLLGYSTFPVDYESNPKDDGVVVSYASLPGGSMEFFNLGRTVTHETGHWLGLYHPFQGLSCTGDGDLVSDTPPQSTPTNGCPEKKDSCEGGGEDSIHNFMDYAYDSCMTSFTPGQVVRMKDQLATYRNMTF